MQGHTFFNQMKESDHIALKVIIKAYLFPILHEGAFIIFLIENNFFSSLSVKSFVGRNPMALIT